jgi:dienelactone hydrolase
VINYAIKKYRVDTTRIYLTGLSLGGGAIMNYAAAYGKRLAAIVPFCESNYPSTTHAAAIAKSGVKVWAFHNDYDTWVSSNYTKNYVTYINNNRPLVPARKTIFPAKGHNCWSKGSDPAYKENYMNIYQWMLSYKR